jgi:hypothetical protein
MFFLIGLIVSAFLPMASMKPFLCMVNSMLPLPITKESIQTFGVVAGASVGALIALKNDPMIARTRAILFFQLLLIVILIFMANSFDTVSRCK